MAININPFLQFNGNCRAAFEFYKNAFGGDFTMISTAEENALPILENEKISLCITSYRRYKTKGSRFSVTMVVLPISLVLVGCSGVNILKAQKNPFAL